MEVYLRSLIPSLMAKGHQVGLLYEFPEVSPGPVVDAPDADIERWTAGSGDVPVAVETWRRLG